MKSKIISLFLIITFSVSAQCLNSLKIHSHNDYEQERPLFSALKNCAKSIEADVHLKDGNLFVAHDEEDIDQTKTIENLYLEPLAKILENNKSEYYFNYELFLLIDFKTDANNTYNKLHEILLNYKKYLTYLDQNKNLIKKNIRIIISGNRPNKSLLDENFNFCFIDGRTSNIGNDKSSLVYPIISEDWNLLIKKITNSENPQILKKGLKKLVDDIHKESKLARLWGIPDEEKYWKLQLDIGIDLINTDRLCELNKYLKMK